MAVYVIAELGPTATAQQNVARLDKRGVGRFGEKMLVDSSRCESLVGDSAPERVVVLEFPTEAQARSWWDAREQSAPPEVRDATRKMIVVHGL